MQQLFQSLINLISLLAIPVIFFSVIALAMAKRVKAYESFVSGGKEGFDVFLRILPYLVAVFVAIGMFRTSGALEMMSNALEPIASYIGMPTDVIPVALLRPLSGSGSMALAADIINTAPDSFNALVSSVIYASADTTFYVLAVYFGAVSVRKTRHALISGLFADAVGVLAALAICHIMFTGPKTTQPVSAQPAAAEQTSTKR